MNKTKKQSLTFTKTSFDFIYPVNEEKRKKELNYLNQVIEDLKKEAKEKKYYFKI